MTVKQAYLAELAAKGYQSDPAQLRAVDALQRCADEWAAYKAFNHHDVEAQDPVKAVDHLRMFDAYVADGVRAFRRRHNIETRVGADPAYRT